jgi:hypothetical protein
MALHLAIDHAIRLHKVFEYAFVYTERATAPFYLFVMISTVLLYMPIGSVTQDLFDVLIDHRFVILAVYADLYFHGCKIKPSASKMIIKQITIGYQSDHSTGPHVAYRFAYIKNSWMQQGFTTKQHRDIWFQHGGPVLYPFLDIFQWFYAFTIDIANTDATPTTHVA